MRLILFLLLAMGCGLSRAQPDTTNVPNSTNGWYLASQQQRRRNRFQRKILTLSTVAAVSFQSTSINELRQDKEKDRPSDQHPKVECQLSPLDFS